MDRNSHLEVINRIQLAIGSANDFIPLHEPEFTQLDKKFVNDCIETGWVSSVGSYVEQFENLVARQCNSSYAVAVANGTVGLELAMKVAGVQADDEVLIPALTFVATANAAHHLGAIPHFIDSSETTLGVDPHALRAYLRAIGTTRYGTLYNKNTKRPISCIVPMHVFGHPIDMEGLSQVASEFGLIVIEDAAEALGSKFTGRACGSFGTLGVVSFNGNKIITTGGGGIILTSNEELAQKAKHLSTTAKISKNWAFEHDQPAYNFRMPNLNAALGVAQMLQLKDRIKQKRILAHRYIASFEDFTSGKIFQEPDRSESNYWLNTLILQSGTSRECRDMLINTLNEAGYMVRPAWELMHQLKFHASSPRAPLPVSEQLAARIINLPSSAKLALKK